MRRLPPKGDVPHYGWYVALIYAAFGFSYIIYMTFFTKYLVAEGNYIQEAAGGLFMAMGVVSLLCGMWGVVSDRIGPLVRPGLLAGGGGGGDGGGLFAANESGHPGFVGIPGT